VFEQPGDYVPAGLAGTWWGHDHGLHLELGREHARWHPAARRDGLLCGGEIIIADKGFAGAEFEGIVASLDAQLIRPDRKDEKPRFGKLGGVRQWIESINDTLKGQLSLEDRGGHTPRASGHASANAYSPSPPASGTTGCSGKQDNSTRPAATSPPTTTDHAQTESVI
jgi:hypothetical protein